MVYLFFSNHLSYQSIIKPKSFILVITFFITRIVLLSQEDSTTYSDDSLRISREEFKYADTFKYTLTGDLPFRENQVTLENGLIVGGVFTGLFVAQHIVQAQTIWAEQSKFRIIEDGNYALYADKFGHFFGTYYSSYLVSEAFMETGFSYNNSILIGSGIGLLYTLYVEIADGFGANFGFSPSDLYANAAGAIFYFAQYHIPYLQNFTPKFSYFPSNWHGHHKRIPHDFFIDDYSSHTLWMSFNLANGLGIKNKYFPDWLELSVGYAARDLCQSSEGVPCNYSIPQDIDPNGFGLYGNRKIILALDYNLVKLLPDGNSYWNWIRQSLNYIKFPAPAMELSPDGKPRFFLAYPFGFAF